MILNYIDFGNEKRPVRGYPWDAGMDVFLPNDVEVEYGETKRIPLGFGVVVPPMYAGFIIMRSSYSKLGLQSGYAAIDSTYNGEVSLIISNFKTDKQTFKAKKGDRICSLIVTPVLVFDWASSEIAKRDGHSFGSTGVRDFVDDGMLLKPNSRDEKSVKHEESLIEKQSRKAK